MLRRVYWDSCCFIGLINDEAEKRDVLRAVWQEAEQGKTEIVTSMFTLTEVVKAKCEGKVKPLPEADDKPVVAFLSQSFVIRLLLDETIANAARRLLRAHRECKKPSDAIHLATALQHNVEELHTFDGSDLLGLTGKTLKKNGQPLTICIPRVSAPLPALPPEPPSQMELEYGGGRE